LRTLRVRRRNLRVVRYVVTRMQKTANTMIEIYALELLVAVSVFEHRGHTTRKFLVCFDICRCSKAPSLASRGNSIVLR
jgi:hypothetical protein